MGKGLGIAGFVISLLAVVFGWSLALISFVLPFIVPILGLILSAVGMGKANKAGVKNGLAVAGLVLGIIATVCMAPVAIILALAMV
ncbi:MAG: hypothetical protein IKC71_03695 [Clostridia bacterium]|nr:hypothetical protein [Clostridia bacterium]